MTEFLAELYVPRTTTGAAGHARDRAESATAELTAEGTSVRLLRAIFVPVDETCLFLFEAPSIDAVRETARRAALSFEHIAEAATDASWSTGDEQSAPSARPATTHPTTPGPAPAGWALQSEGKEMTKTAEAPAATPNLAAVKQRQQQAWASGDFHAVAARIVLVAEQLVDTADLRAGWQVLDVATGSGNAAIAAARLGCRAIGVDYVPSLL